MGTITYNANRFNVARIFRATSGGTVFSADLSASVAFDYFVDSPAVNDAIYFGGTTISWSNLYLNVGTAMTGTDIVLAWEYYCHATASWRAMHNLADGSNALTTTGSVVVDFPIQTGSIYTTIAGYNIVWVRCRLVSFITVAEGGANATSRAQRSDGQLHMASYTDASPCTWTILYDWVVANAPQIGASKWGGTAFKFDNLALSIASRLRSNGEVVFIGNGSSINVQDISYLHSGTKQGDDGWTGASHYFFDMRAGGNVITSTVETKIYGGSFGRFNNIVDGITTIPAIGAYFGMRYGEWVGVYNIGAGYFVEADINSCIVEAPIISNYNAVPYPVKMRVANEPQTVWMLYGNALRIEAPSYVIPPSLAGAYAVFNCLQCTASSNAVDIINPTPSLPSQDSSPRVAVRKIDNAGFTNLTKFLYYDASAGTYEDRTSIASDLVNSLDLSGDAGDCFYFLSPGITSGLATHPVLFFEGLNSPNDYEYIWEYRKSSVWTPSIVLDGTGNLAQEGRVFLGSNNAAWDSHTISGSTGCWYRLRIVTKGASNPAALRARSRTDNIVTNNTINERYTCTFEIVDSNGEPIDSATVKAYSSTGTLEEELSTDAGGLTEPVDLKVSVTAMSAFAPDADYNFAKTSLNPFTITVTAAGYETYTAIMDITQKMDTTIALKPAIEVMPIIGGGMALKVDPTNSTVDRDLLIDI